MSVPLISTARLDLRPFEESDADSLAAALGDWQVVRWLSGPPWPYGIAEARAFIRESGEDDAAVWAITRDSNLVGAIAHGSELGYWIRREAWRCGYAGEAVRAILQHHFETSDEDVLAGADRENRRSIALLQGLGFRAGGTDRTWFACRNAWVRRMLFRLARADWTGRTA